MTYTMKDFEREYILPYIFEKYSTDEILENYSIEERLKGIPEDVILKKFSTDKRIKGISPKELSELIKKRFSKEELRKWIEEMKKDS